LVKTARTAAFGPNAWLDRGNLESRRYALIAAAALITPFIALVQAPSAAPAPSGDDTPVLLTPKGEHDNGEDEAGFDKLRDAYYWSRLLAGEDGGITMDQAATLRSKASTQASSIPAETTSGAPRGGAWTSAGPTRSCRSGGRPTRSRPCPGASARWRYGTTARSS
jgi:hypothetical protein